jgi:uncharacterized membrane protein
MSDPIAVRLDPPRLRAAPGTEASATITIENVSADGVQFRLGLKGPLARWARLETEQVGIFLSESRQVRISLKPPQDTNPALYPLELHVTSQDRPGLEVVTQLTVDVAPAAPQAAPVGGPIGPVARPAGPPVPPPGTGGGDDDIAVRAEPIDEPSLPGTAGRWRLHVTNKSKILTTFGFSVASSRRLWLTAEPPQVATMPRETQTALLTVYLEPETPVGTHLLSLRTYSHLNPRKRQEASLRLQVRPPTGPPGQPGHPIGTGSGDGTLEIVARESDATVVPGKQSSIGLTVQNTGGTPLATRMSCSGVPDAWARPEPTTAQVPAQTAAPVGLVMTFPQDAPNGSYPLRVRAEVQQDRGVFAQLDLTLTNGTGVAPNQPLRISASGPLTVAPGGEAEGRVSIEGLHSLRLEVELKIDGVDPGWSALDPGQVTVIPGQPTAARLLVRPPLELDRAIAGRYPVRVLGTSRQFPDRSAEARLELEVQRIGDYEPVVEPAETRSAREASYPIRVRNNANAPLRTRFSGSDTGQELHYQFEPAELKVPAGGEAVGRLTIRAPESAPGAHRTAFRISTEGSFDLQGGSSTPAPRHTASGVFVQVPPRRLLVSVNPTRVDGGPTGEYEVVVANPGDGPVTAFLSATSRSDRLEFQFLRPDVTVKPHEEMSGRLVVRAPRSRGKRVEQFEVTATPEGEDALAGTAEAEMTIGRSGGDGPSFFARLVRFLAALTVIAALIAALWLLVLPLLSAARPPPGLLTRLPTPPTRLPVVPTPAAPGPSPTRPPATAPAAVPPTVAPPTAAPTAAKAAATAPAESAPVAAVRRYYELVGARQYPAAYELMGPGVRSGASLAVFTGWFADKEAISVESATLVAGNPANAEVEAVVVSTDRIGGQRVTRRYRERWGLIMVGGAWRLNARLGTVVLGDVAQ